MSSYWGLTQGANLGPAPSPGPQIENALAENNALHPLLPLLRQSGALRQFFPRLKIASPGLVTNAELKVDKKKYNLITSMDLG